LEPAVSKPSVRKAYLEELHRIQERIHELFDQTLSTGYANLEGGRPGTWPPSVDLFETDLEFVLCAELPGVRAEDVDLRIDDHRIELSGRRQLPGEGHHFLRMERSYGPFRRVFPLGTAVDPDRSSNRFEDGLLTVRLPKRTAAALSGPVGEDK
jgi:HSP20 family protein